MSQGDRSRSVDEATPASSWRHRLGLGLVGVAGVVWFVTTWPETSPFDRVAWDAGVGQGQSRYQIAADLLERGGLPGLSRSAAIQMLGDPIQNRFAGDGSLVYWLRRDPVLGIDCDWLVLPVTDGDRIGEPRIISD